jgi:hypothetical protein
MAIAQDPGHRRFGRLGLNGGDELTDGIDILNIYKDGAPFY